MRRGAARQRRACASYAAKGVSKTVVLEQLRAPAAAKPAPRIRWLATWDSAVDLVVGRGGVVWAGCFVALLNAAAAAAAVRLLGLELFEIITGLWL